MDLQNGSHTKHSVVRKFFAYPIELLRRICRQSMHFSHPGPIKIATKSVALNDEHLKDCNEVASMIKALDNECYHLYAALQTNPDTVTERHIRNEIPGKVMNKCVFPNEICETCVKNNHKESLQNGSLRNDLLHQSKSTEVLTKKCYNKSVATIQTDEYLFDTNKCRKNDNSDVLFIHKKFINDEDHRVKFEATNEILEDYKDVTIYHLPNEIMLKIFSYLTTTDLCGAVAFVNQHWKILSEDVSLWTDVEFHKNLVTTDFVISALAKLPRLNSLTLCRREDAYELLQCVCLYNSQLKKLVLRACYCKTCMGFIRETLLCRVLECVPELISLTIENCKTLNEEFFRTLRNSLPNLKEIVLTTKASHICSEPLDFHDENYQLESLRYDITALSNDNCACLAGRFRHTLRILELDATELEDPSMLAIAECYNLEKLHLIKAQKISDFGLVQIGRLSLLKDLCLSGTFCVSQEGWMALFKFPNLRNLCQLELQRRCFELTEKALIACALTCMSLEKVSVSQNFRLSARLVGRMFLYGKQIKSLDYHTACRVIKLRTLMQYRKNCGYFCRPAYYLRKEPIMLIMIPKEQDVALKINSCTCLHSIS